MKQCIDCEKTLPLTNFYKFTKGEGTWLFCKSCNALRGLKDPFRVFRRIYSSQRFNSKRRNHPMPTYSLEELVAWADKQPNTAELWDSYVASGYNKMTKISVDRIDNSLPYSLGNIQLMSWQENKDLGHQARRAGNLGSDHRPVNAYHLDGTLHKKYVSVQSAARDVNGSAGSIHHVASGKTLDRPGGYKTTIKKHKGYSWAWA